MKTSEKAVTIERHQLLMFCRRRVGDAQVAEDITQEALLIALRKPSVTGDHAAYLFGIARRLCKSYLAQQQRDNARFPQWNDSTNEFETPLAVNHTTPTPDPLDSLIQSEREQLIDRAFATLPSTVQEMLVARYIDEIPLTELATQWGVSENTAAVRLHRSREALRKTLSTSLRAEASEHGLLDPKTAQDWHQTTIYCCRCGVDKLQGRFESGSALSGEPPQFALSCPTCDKRGSLIGMTSQVAPLPAERVLNGVKGFRAGLNRVNHWWQSYIDNALLTRKSSCTRCGAQAEGRIGKNGFFLTCARCEGMTFFIRPTGLMYHDEEFQQFWRRHPRARSREELSILCEGRQATLTAFTDNVTSARLEMVFDSQTLRRMR